MTCVLKPRTVAAACVGLPRYARARGSGCRNLYLNASLIYPNLKRWNEDYWQKLILHKIVCVFTEFLKRADLKFLNMGHLKPWTLVAL